MAINSTWFGKNLAHQFRHNPPNKINYFFIFLLSILPLSGSFYVEFIEDITPCHLCVYQRIPYILIIVLLLGRQFIARYFFAIIQILLIANFIITLIHFGIIQEWFYLDIGCVNDLQKSKDFADFKNMILQNQEIPCNQDTWQVFGISITLWHLLYIIFYFIITIVISNKLWLKSTKSSE
jgi:disulfide bond formation protein DsbB